MARNRYAGYCYCCGKYVPVGYGHFDRLNSALTAEKSKYKELQRYNVDCTKEAASLLCENSDLRKTLAALTARAEAAEAERDTLMKYGRCCTTCGKEKCRMAGGGINVHGCGSWEWRGQQAGKGAAPNE